MVGNNCNLSWRGGRVVMKEKLYDQGVGDERLMRLVLRWCTFIDNRV